MHHLEARFDFVTLRDQLQRQGVNLMKPFSDFDFLRQAFTEGERWPVRRERAERLFAAGLITQDQCEQFVQNGAIGSLDYSWAWPDGLMSGTTSRSSRSRFTSHPDPRRALLARLDRFVDELHAAQPVVDRGELVLLGLQGPAVEVPGLERLRRGHLLADPEQPPRLDRLHPRLFDSVCSCRRRLDWSVDAPPEAMRPLDCLPSRQHVQQESAFYQVPLPSRQPVQQRMAGDQCRLLVSGLALPHRGGPGHA